MAILEKLTPNANGRHSFTGRHIGPSEVELAGMLESLNLPTLDALISETLPAAIALKTPLETGDPLSEADMLSELKAIADKNKVYRSYIGMGYYGTHTPNVILRNVLENPGWYTAYTPYQAEIAQGRLEALLNFQQMVMDLTGMEIANASLLDEATAAAEAMTLCKRSGKSKSNRYFVADDIHPQTLDVIRTRAAYMGFEIIVGDPDELDAHDVFGAQLQYPGSTGEVRDLSPIIATAHERGALVAVASDLLALALLTPPGEMGADVVLGSAQRFGVPLGYGGPHAAFFATREAFKRSLPGRVIGVSVDTRGKTALRMAMQTREQHIRREKATSNICTAQALLANMASFYAVYHGPEGIRNIAERTHQLTQTLAAGLKKTGFRFKFDSYFDTLTVETDKQREIFERGLESHLNLRLIDDNALGISLDETTTQADLKVLLNVFTGNTEPSLDEPSLDTEPSGYAFPKNLQRQSDYLSHPVFNRYHSETAMMRYLKRLENKDFSLVHGMIPLGSCTMKLNAAAEMQSLSWAEFADIHPFAPQEQTLGYEQLLAELREMLLEITGYDAISMQPNSGAQGEYAGLLAIRKYQAAQGEGARDICLIPSSAHGTNPASATMMGMQVVVVKTDEDGNINLDDLRTKAEAHSDKLAALMITYPSTHGVFETGVQAACDLIHEHGGQVYMDGANLNAQVGLTNPALIGSDVSHLNLHKTFCIPHGGGGPGMGPIGVKEHLAPYLPGHVEHGSSGAVSAAPYGSPLILPISWAYIKMMGSTGLKRASEVAILNANYIAKRLEGHFDVLYKGKNGHVAHECIIDIRPIKEGTGISEVDIAKRLMDYGFHAPTMSWPVVGTMMIEPTESESKQELDRFCDALISIRDEIRTVERGELSAGDSPLRHAPHTLDDLVTDWQRSYSREVAVFPSQQLRANKFWASVNRIDDVYGDRNFVCSCPPLDAYENEAAGAND